MKRKEPINNDELGQAENHLLVVFKWRTKALKKWIIFFFEMTLLWLSNISKELQSITSPIEANPYDASRSVAQLQEAKSDNTQTSSFSLRECSNRDHPWTSTSLQRTHGSKKVQCLTQCFSTFFGSRHPVRLKKIWQHPYPS